MEAPDLCEVDLPRRSRFAAPRWAVLMLTMVAVLADTPPANSPVALSPNQIIGGRKRLSTAWLSPLTLRLRLKIRALRL